MFFSHRVLPIYFQFWEGNLKKKGEKFEISTVFNCYLFLVKYIYIYIATVLCFRDATGKFPDFPSPEDGGSASIFAQKTPEQVINPITPLNPFRITITDPILYFY